MNDSFEVVDIGDDEFGLFLENAEKLRNVIKQTVDVDLDYGIEGVQWVDGFINRSRERWGEEARNLYLFAIGSYLGESIRRTLKGKWVRHQEFGPGVLHRTGIDFPFNKVQKQILGGEGDSILGMFSATLALHKVL